MTSASARPRRSSSPPVPRKRWWVGARRIEIAVAGVLIAICAMFAAGLYDAREDTRARASVSLQNLSAAVTQDIERNLELYDLSLRGVLERVANPEVMATRPDLRQMILFDRSATAEYLGAMLVLDVHGQPILDSQSVTPRATNYADRDYFQVHRQKANVGLYIGQPIASKTDGTMLIGLSRRINQPDGSFGGVVVGTLKLRFFNNVFSRVHLGSGGAMTLFRMDGTIVMREPYDPSVIGRVITPLKLFGLVDQAPDGEYEARSTVDGVERLYHYRQIGRLPLVQTVAMSLEQIYAEWWRRAIVTTSVLGILCSIILALTMLAKRELRRREVAERALIELSERDDLTGLANRRRFDQALASEWQRAARHGTPLALLMIDADQFKLFNDTLGHQAGDHALAALGQSLRHTVKRPGDLAARYGGEEFAVILPHTTASAATLLAEQIRADIESLEIAHPASPRGRFTVSIGLAGMVPTSADLVQDLVASADQALYQAKAQGRNRVVLGPLRDRRMSRSSFEARGAPAL